MKFIPAFFLIALLVCVHAGGWDSRSAASKSGGRVCGRLCSAQCRKNWFVGLVSDLTGQSSALPALRRAVQKVEEIERGYPKDEEDDGERGESEGQGEAPEGK
ncbi:unnamed protein product [Cylicocyclus nassatus]|uniref:Uncharacterized protein n=1 Tax=Cylicocyclus nassatus TaxID=53992 RepID=A0AA36GWU8_CYLNA|nr:unnamed protein product [Cylicocyclus nassatus]